MGSRARRQGRVWLVHPNGARQLIDPREFDLGKLAEQVRHLGGRLVLEPAPVLPGWARPVAAPEKPAATSAGGSAGATLFEPPVSALAELFRHRFERVHLCLVDYHLDINTRPTNRVLGGYYKRRRLVRVYSHDRETGRRPLEELFDTYLHEMAHHLEYTEPLAFDAAECGRVRGRMHSPLFWKILGDLKKRWATVQALR
jgi:hypothetical protein